MWIRVAHSFRQAEEFERQYYRSMSPEERLSTVQFLRESLGQFSKKGQHAYRKGLRRVIRVVKPA